MREAKEKFSVNSIEELEALKIKMEADIVSKLDEVENILQERL